MSRRIRSILWHGAASALFVMAEPAFADPVDEVNSLPQWVLRAQHRLGLSGAQQRDLRTLVDDNNAKMQALPRQFEPAQMQALQREFRAGLARILEPEQLAEWDTLLEELLSAVHMRNSPMVAGRSH